MKRSQVFTAFMLCLMIAFFSGSVASQMVLDLREGRCLTKQDFTEAMDNKLCWISVDLEIYDVTKSMWWANGSFMGHKCGDITSTLELGRENISINRLLDYYDDMTYMSRAGRLCDTRSVEKPDTCGNKACDGGENFRSCPQDCPPWIQDDYCVPFKDFICDPDCGRKYDPDCICIGDGICETEFENHTSCAADCPPAYGDGLCYHRKDAFCDPDCSPEEDPDCAVNTTIDSTPGTPDTLVAVNKAGDKGRVTTSQDVISFLPYIALLILLAAGAFLMHKKMENKKIEKEKEAFRKWKEEQEKLSGKKS